MIQRMWRFLTIPRVSGVSGISPAAAESKPTIAGIVRVRQNASSGRQALSKSHALDEPLKVASAVFGAPKTAPPDTSDAAVVIFSSGRLALASSELNTATGRTEVV